MGVLVFSLVVSSVYLLLVAGMAYSKDGPKNVTWWSAGALVFSFCAFTPVVAVQTLLTGCVAAVCWRRGLPARRLVQGAVGTMAFAYLAALGLVALDVWKNQQLRKEYPLVSLKDRLDFETKTAQTNAQFASLELSPSVSKRLVLAEENRAPGARTMRLAMLHSASTEAFIRQIGFGPVRGLRMPRPEHVELPPITPLTLPTPAVNDYPPAPDQPPPMPPETRRLLLMHDGGLKDLFAPERMGWVKDRQQVAGFVPHQFTSVPKLDPVVNEQWELVHLQLIGLLKHPEPVAYVTEHLPVMDQLEDFPTRPLIAFELRALDQLRTQEDLVVDDSQPGRVRMVGSLRAAETCLQCHEVPHGALLGALTYELRTMQQVPVPARRDPQL